MFDIITAMQKKVLIALKMAGIAGQEKLSGIFRYLGEDSPWETTILRTDSECTPARVRDALTDGYNGFIFSIPEAVAAADVLAECDIPTIAMDIHVPRLSARRANIAFIRNSGQLIGEAAADHLLSIGRCRSYAFLHKEGMPDWSTTRFKAFRERLNAHGLWCHEFTSCEGLARLARPVGLFAAHDDTAYRTLAFCKAHHLRVPEDVMLLGTDNDTLICENANPRLSSVQPDFEQEGFLAAQTLDRMMEARRLGPSESSSSTTLFVGVKRIVRRDSTAETSQAGKLVQKAVAYIRKNVIRGISVDDVARHLGCSRRLADLRFRELQGTTIGETIIALRLDTVRHLLATTRDSIDEISRACGYQNPNYLKNLFKKRFGLTMRDFRKHSRGERLLAGKIVI